MKVLSLKKTMMARHAVSARPRRASALPWQHGGGGARHGRHYWNTNRHGARKTVDYVASSHYKRIFGAPRSAARVARQVWRLVEAEKRNMLVAFENCIGILFEDISFGWRPPQARDTGKRNGAARVSTDLCAAVVNSVSMRPRTRTLATWTIREKKLCATSCSHVPFCESGSSVHLSTEQIEQPSEVFGSVRNPIA